MVAVLTVVGTVAYLTATDAENNTMTVGDASIKIVEFERDDGEKSNGDETLRAFAGEGKLLHPSVVLDESFKYSNPDYKATLTDNFVAWEDADIKVDGKTDYKTPIWNPAKINNELDKMVFVKNTGKMSVYVRICFAFEAGNYVRYDRFAEMVHLNKNESVWTWDWVEEKENHVTEIDGTRYYIAWATYQKPVAPGEYTEISLSQIALDFAALNDHAKAFGEKYEVLTFAQGVQADEFKQAEGAAAALANAFGDSIPFENVKHLEFTDLKTALRYLNADGETALTSNEIVNSVTFGLTADHAEKVKDYKGIFIANNAGEADFTAYAYYVPNGDKYDIYVLADNWKIYAPVSSDGLFYVMKGLTKVDTSNIDFSYATTFQDMFRDCKSLTELDTSDWDVSKVTNMKYMFQSCEMLNNIDVSNWNTSSLNDATQMFIKCKTLTSLDVSNWDVSNLTLASMMFRECSNLTYLDVSKWKVDNLEKVNEMFNECGSLQKLDVSDWKLNKVSDFEAMFQNCSSLTVLDVSQWTINNATKTKAMFSGCSKLKALNVSNFDVSKVTSMETMFRWCSSLESLDLSAWKTDSLQDMSQMFLDCSSLTSINVANLNVSAVTNMFETFRQCSSLETIDLSGWNTANVTDMQQMFSMSTNKQDGSPTSLKTIYVGANWSTNGVVKSKGMFELCTKLVGNISYDPNKLDAQYANYTNGYLTQK